MASYHDDFEGMMMNLQKIMMAMMIFGLVACTDKSSPTTDTPVDDGESVSMSAEPAEPTGVMNAEPVAEMDDEPTTQTEPTAESSAQSGVQ